MTTMQKEEKECTGCTDKEAAAGLCDKKTGERLDLTQGGPHIPKQEEHDIKHNVAEMYGSSPKELEPPRDESALTEENIDLKQGGPHIPKQEEHDIKHNIAEMYGLWHKPRKNEYSLTPEHMDLKQGGPHIPKQEEQDIKHNITEMYGNAPNVFEDVFLEKEMMKETKKEIEETKDESGLTEEKLDLSQGGPHIPKQDERDIKHNIAEMYGNAPSEFENIIPEKEAIKVIEETKEESGLIEENMDLKQGGPHIPKQEEHDIKHNVAEMYGNAPSEFEDVIPQKEVQKETEQKAGAGLMKERIDLRQESR